MLFLHLTLCYYLSAIVETTTICVFYFSASQKLVVQHNFTLLYNRFTSVSCRKCLMNHRLRQKDRGQTWYKNVLLVIVQIFSGILHAIFLIFTELIGYEIIFNSNQFFECYGLTGFYKKK